MPITASQISQPIYKRLYQRYREDIITQKYRPGSLLPSISNLQAEHGISRETAKLVLKSLARDGLILQRRGKGSFVADLGKRQMSWGIVMPFLSPQFESLLFNLKQSAEGSGIHTEYFFTYNNPEDEIRLVGELINRRFQAVIVIPVADESATSEFYTRLVSGGSLVILLDHSMAGSFFPYVIQSYDLGVTRATEYLLEKSKGNIGFVRDELWDKRNMVQELMETTFRDCVERKSPERKPLTIDHIYMVTARYLEENRMDGIFCCNDRDAVRIIGRLKEEGISVPGDIHLVSYGNTDLARYFTPAITSVDCHYQKMAGKLSGIIRMHAGGEDTSLCQHVIQPELIIRQT